MGKEKERRRLSSVSSPSFFWIRDSTALVLHSYIICSFSLSQGQPPGWRRDTTLTGDRQTALRDREPSEEVSQATVLTPHPTSHRACEHRPFKASLSVSQGEGGPGPQLLLFCQSSSEPDPPSAGLSALSLPHPSSPLGSNLISILIKLPLPSICNHVQGCEFRSPI